MAAEQLYGKPAGAVANAPPPSTLAAQLVENLPASTKSTRSDENTELRSLSAVIERVKNNPGLLRTPDERTEHNHMLIYVYSRVVLDGIKLDDPFADKKVIRSEALKAINFLKVTIEETPIVMNYTTDGKQFVFRGEEPLWVWVFPKVLKLLGHARCLDLTAPIEEFFRFIILVVSEVGSMGALLSSMLLYLRETSNGELPVRMRQHTIMTNGHSSPVSPTRDGAYCPCTGCDYRHEPSSCRYTRAAPGKTWHSLRTTDYIRCSACVTSRAPSSSSNINTRTPVHC